MKCSKCNYVYNGIEKISNCPKCGHSFGTNEEEGLSNKSKAAVAIGAVAGAVAGGINLAMKDGKVFASNKSNDEKNDSSNFGQPEEQFNQNQGETTSNETTSGDATSTEGNEISTEQTQSGESSESSVATNPNDNIDISDDNTVPGVPGTLGSGSGTDEGTSKPEPSNPNTGDDITSTGDPNKGDENIDSGESDKGDENTDSGETDKGEEDTDSGETDKGEEDTGSGDSDKGEEDTDSGETDESEEDTASGETDKGDEDTDSGDSDKGDENTDSGETDKGEEDTGSEDSDKGDENTDSGDSDKDEGDKDSGNSDKGDEDKDSGNSNEDEDKPTDDTTTPQTNGTRSSSGGGGGGSGIGDIGFEPGDLDEALGFFNMGYAYTGGTSSFDSINSEGTNVASQVKSAFAAAEECECISGSGAGDSAYTTLIGAMGNNGAGGTIAEIKNNLTRLYNSYLKLVGGEDAYKAYVGLDIKAHLDMSKDSEEYKAYTSMLESRGIALDDLSVSTLNDLNSYFEEEIEKLSNENISQAQLQQTFLYKMTGGAENFNERAELLSWYKNQMDALCITMVTIGGSIAGSKALIDLENTKLDNGKTYLEYINENLNNGIGLPVYEEDGEIPPEETGNYKSREQMQLEMVAYGTFSAISDDQLGPGELNILESIDNEILRRGKEYYAMHNEPLPVDSYYYALAKTGVINQAFKDGQYLTAEQRDESGNRIIDIFNSKYLTGQDSDNRVARDPFEESFYLTQEYFDKIAPAYTRDKDAFETMFTTDSSGKTVLNPGGVYRFFESAFSGEELEEMFGDQYEYVSSSGNHVILASEQEMAKVFLEKFGNEKFVKGSEHVTYDANGNLVLKPGSTVEDLMADYTAKKWTESSTQFSNIGKQMQAMNTLQQYMASGIENQKRPYQQQYDSEWEAYNKEKEKFDEIYQDYLDNPEKYAEEPKFELPEPTLMHPDEKFPMDPKLSQRASEIYLEFANGMSDDFTTSTVAFTEFLPDVTAYDGFDPAPNFWEVGKYSKDMVAILGSVPVVPDNGEVPNPNAEEKYKEFCTQAVENLKMEQTTLKYIAQKYNAGLAGTGANVATAISESEDTLSGYRNMKYYLQNELGDLPYAARDGGGPSRIYSEEEKAEMRKQLEELDALIKNEQNTLEALKARQTTLTNISAYNTDIIEGVNAQMKLIIPRDPSFQACNIVDPAKRESYVSDYMITDEYGNQYPCGNQLSGEALSDIDAKVRAELNKEGVKESDFKSAKEYEAYVNNQISYRKAMYVMELQMNGVYINPASLDPRTKSYVESFGYLKQNNGVEDYINTLYCMEYTSIHDGIGEFSAMFQDNYTDAFNFEAERRARAYLYDYANGLKESWGADGLNAFEAIGFGAVWLGEHLLEDVLIPAANGIAGSIKGIGKAFENIIEDISGQEINPMDVVSINDAMWEKIYQIGASEGQLSQLQTYVMQAANSVGNMAIPMVLSLCSMGTLGTVWMGVSAFGNTIEECKKAGDMSLGTSYIYAVCSAASEVVLEKALGAMPGIGKAAATGFPGVVNSMLSEAKEEAIQTLVDPLLKDAIVGIESLLGLRPEHLGDVNWALDDLTAQDFIDAAIVAMISSGMTSSTKIVKSTASLIQYGNSSLIEISNFRMNQLMRQGMTADQAKSMVKTELAQIATNSVAYNQLIQNLKNNPDIQAAYEAEQALLDEAKKNNKNFSDPRSEFNLDDYVKELAYVQTVTGGVTTPGTINAYTSILSTAQTEVKNLTKQMTELQSQLETATESGKADIQAKIDALQPKLDAANTKLQAATAGYLNATINQQESLAFHENAYENLLVELNQLMEQKAELEAKSELTTEEQQILSNLESQINDINENQLPRLEQTINETRSQIESKINQEQAQINELLNEQSNLLAELETAVDEKIAEIKQKIKANDQKISDMRNQKNSDMISLNQQTQTQLETRIETLKNLLTKTADGKTRIKTQLEIIQNKLVDTLLNEKTHLTQGINELNAEKATFREGATTDRIDQLIELNENRIGEIDTKLQELSDSGVEVVDNTPEITKNITTNIDTKVTTMTYLGSSILGIAGTGSMGSGSATIGNITNMIENKVAGLQGQLKELQKQGNKENKGSKADKEISKKKAELKQEIKKQKQIKDDLLKNMHEYGLDSNATITDFMDMLQKDIDNFYGIESQGRFVDKSFIEELKQIQIDGLTTETSKKVTEMTKSINEFISFMSKYNKANNASADIAKKIKEVSEVFIAKNRAAIAAISAKIPHMTDIATSFDSVGTRLELIDSIPNNVKAEILNDYKAIQSNITEIVSGLTKGTPILDAKQVAEVHEQFQAFKEKFVSAVNAATEAKTDGKINLSEDASKTFDGLLKNITDVLAKLDEFSEIKDLSANIEIISSQIQDLHNLSKTQSELEVLLNTETAMDKILSKLSELKNNIVKYAKEASKSKEITQVIEAVNSEAVIESNEKTNIGKKIVTQISDYLAKLGELIKTHVADPTTRIKLYGTVQNITTEIVDYAGGVFINKGSFSQEMLKAFTAKLAEIGNKIKGINTESVAEVAENVTDVSTGFENVTDDLEVLDAMTGEIISETDAIVQTEIEVNNEPDINEIELVTTDQVAIQNPEDKLETFEKLVSSLNENGQVDLDIAEKAGEIFVDKAPMRDLLGNSTKYVVKTKDGYAIFKEIKADTFGNIGELLGYQIANNMKLSAAQYNMATLSGTNGVLSQNFIPANAELLTGNELVNSTLQYASAIKGLYNELISTYESSAKSIDDMKNVISELTVLHDYLSGLSTEFNSFVTDINIDNITAETFDDILNNFTNYYNQTFEGYNGILENIQNNTIGINDLLAIADIYSSATGVKFENRQQFIENLAKMQVFDIITSSNTRSLADMGIIFDHSSNSFTMAPIYDNSDIFGLDMNMDELSDKLASLGEMVVSAEQLSQLNELALSDPAIMDMINDICANFNSENVASIFETIETQNNIKISDDVKALVTQSIEANIEQIQNFFNNTPGASQEIVVDGVEDSINAEVELLNNEESVAEIQKEIDSIVTNINESTDVTTVNNSFNKINQLIDNLINNINISTTLDNVLNFVNNLNIKETLSTKVQDALGKIKEDITKLKQEMSNKQSNPINIKQSVEMISLGLQSIKQSIIESIEAYNAEQSKIVESIQAEVLDAEFESVTTTNFITKAIDYISNVISTISDRIAAFKDLNTINGFEFSFNHIAALLNINIDVSDISSKFKTNAIDTEGIKTKFESIAKKFKEIAQTYYTKDAETANAINGTNVVENNSSKFSENISKVFSKLQQSIENATDMLAAKKTELKQSIDKLNTNIKKYLTDFKNMTVQESTKLLEEISNGYNNLVSQLKSNVDTKVQEVKSAVVEATKAHVDKVLDANYADVNTALEELLKHDKNADSVIKVIEAFVNDGKCGMFDLLNLTSSGLFGTNKQVLNTALETVISNNQSLRQQLYDEIKSELKMLSDKNMGIGLNISDKDIDVLTDALLGTNFVDAGYGTQNWTKFKEVLEPYVSQKIKDAVASGKAPVLWTKINPNSLSQNNITIENSTFNEDSLYMLQMIFPNWHDGQSTIGNQGLETLWAEMSELYANAIIDASVTDNIQFIYANKSSGFGNLFLSVELPALLKSGKFNTLVAHSQYTNETTNIDLKLMSQVYNYMMNNGMQDTLTPQKLSSWMSDLLNGKVPADFAPVINANANIVSNVQTVTAQQTALKKLDFISYANSSTEKAVDMFNAQYSKATADWVAKLTPQERRFVLNYTAEGVDSAPGYYRVVNGILRGQITENSTHITLYGPFGSGSKTMTIEDFVRYNESNIIKYYAEIFPGQNLYQDFAGTTEQKLFQAFYAYQVKSAEIIIQAINKFEYPDSSKGIVLYREQGLNSLTKQFGFSPNQSVEEIYQALTTGKDGSKQTQFVFPGFTSASIHDCTQNGTKAYFRIKCDETIKLADVMQVAAAGDLEGEVLLNAGQYFKIESVEKNANGGIIINLVPFTSTGDVVNASTLAVSSQASAINPIAEAIKHLNSGNYQGIAALNLSNMEQEKFFSEAIQNGYKSQVKEMASHFVKAAEAMIKVQDFSFLNNTNMTKEILCESILEISNEYGTVNTNQIIQSYLNGAQQKALFVDMVSEGMGLVVEKLATTNVYASRTLLDTGNTKFLSNKYTNESILLDSINYMLSLNKLSSLSGITTNNSKFAFYLLMNGISINTPSTTTFNDGLYQLLLDEVILKSGTNNYVPKALNIIKDIGYHNKVVTITNVDQVLNAINHKFYSFKVDQSIANSAINIIEQVASKPGSTNAYNIVYNFAVNNPQLFPQILNSNISVDIKVKLLGTPAFSSLKHIPINLDAKVQMISYLSQIGLDGDSCCNFFGIDSTIEANRFVAVRNIAEMQKIFTKDLIERLKIHKPGTNEYNYILSLLKNEFQYSGLEDQTIIKNVCNQYGNAQKTLFDIGVDKVHTLKYNGIDIKVYCTDMSNIQTALKRVTHITKLIDSLPYVYRSAITELNIFDTRNPFDDFWACEYNKDISKNFKSAATGGFGTVNIWDFTPDIDTIAHELGHCIDSKIFEFIHKYKGYISNSNGWQEAKKADGAIVSEYGEKAIVEDFAESASLYITNPAKFYKKYPNRAALLEKMFAQYLNQINGINEFMTRAQVKKALVNLGFETEMLNDYISKGYTIFDIKNAWYRTLTTNQDFDVAISQIRNKNESGEFISKLFGKKSKIVYIKENTTGFTVNNSHKTVTYEQTKTSLDSVFYTMLNKFGYKETIDRLNKYLATGNENLITRTNDARTIIKGISMNHIQRYLNDTINGISSTPSPKPIQKVERINTGFDGYSDILKINQLDSETIATINSSTDSLVVFDEDIDINEELLSQLSDDVQISYGKNNYVYSKENMLKIINTIQEITSKVNSNFTKTETIKFVYDYLTKNIAFNTDGNPDLNALVTGEGTPEAFSEIFNEVLEKLNLKGVITEIVKGKDINGEPVIFNAVKSDGITYVVDANGFNKTNLDGITLTSDSILFDSITENDLFLATKIAELVDAANAEGMNLHEAGSQTTSDTSVVDPLLQTKSDELAKSLFDKASMIEPTVTADMKELVMEGSKLIGLEYSLKSIASLARKILSVHLMSLKTPNVKTLESIAENIGDCIRYTLVCEEGNYVQQVKHAMESLKAKGYTLKSFRNTWSSKTYKGINTNFIAPDGTVLELQFHTETSYDVKGDFTHIYYEIIRNNFASKLLKDIACEIREAYQKLITIPNGALELTQDDMLPAPPSVATPAAPSPVTELTLSDLQPNNYQTDPVVNISGKKVMIKGKKIGTAYDGGLKHFVQIPASSKYVTEIYRSELTAALKANGFSETAINAVMKACIGYIGNSKLAGKSEKLQNFCLQLGTYLNNNNENEKVVKIFEKIFKNIPESELVGLADYLENADYESFMKPARRIDDKNFNSWSNLFKATGLHLEMVEKLDKIEVLEKNGAKFDETEFAKYMGISYKEFIDMVYEAQDALMKNALKKYIEGDNILGDPNIDGIGLPIPVEASIDPNISKKVEIIAKLPKDGEEAEIIVFHALGLEEKEYSNPDKLMETLYAKQAKGIVNQVKKAKEKGLKVEFTEEAIWEYISNIDAEYSLYIRDDKHRIEVYNIIKELLIKENEK